MKGLKEFAKKFESLMTATAFAEAGEFEAAREVLKEETQPGKRQSKSPAGAIRQILP